MKKGDIVIIIITIVFVFLVFFINNFNIDNKNSKIAVVSVDGKIIKRIDLGKVKKTYTFSLDEAKVTLKVKKGYICFYKSACVNKYCIKSGWITNPGEKVVCLPQKTKIYIENSQESEIDSISH